jgi:hypothetical protein
MLDANVLTFRNVGSPNSKLENLMRHLKVIPFLCAALLTGCATVEIKPITTGQADDPTINGARFFQPSPYLLVTATQVDPNSTPQPGGDAAAPGAPPAPDKPAPAKAAVPTSTMQIIWLPNMTKPYVINVKPGWGTVNGSFTLDNGWNLTSVGSQLDSKIPETITAVSGLLTAAAGTAGGAAVHPALKTLIPPGLYRIEFDPTTGLVSNLALVTTPPPPQ